MNTTFDIQRFWKLVCNEYHVQLKKSLLMMGFLLGIPVIYFGIGGINHDLISLGSTFALFFCVILIFQGLITSVYFSEFSSKPRSISFLLTPASKIEKFAAKSLYCLVVFPALFACYCWLVLELNIIYNLWLCDTLELQYKDPDFQRHFFDLRYSFPDIKTMSHLISVWFFAVASFLCGAQVFKKLVHIKTFLIFFVFMFLMTFLTKLLYYFASGHSAYIYVPFFFISEKSVGNYSFIDDFPYFIQCLLIFTGLYLIVVSWFKFNEKTV